MISTYVKKQGRFAINVARLIEFANSIGYTVTFGEAWRTQEQARANEEKGIGIKNSVHCLRLAIDINLFTDQDITWDIKDFKILGNFWKKLDPDARWGGDFKKIDAVHFSFEHGGIK